MSSLREIKDRIGSVRSTLKITSAMKLVAASELRKAQKAMEAAELYGRELSATVAAVFRASGGRVPLPASPANPRRRVAVVAISSNNALCGSFNVNAVKAALAEIARYDDVELFPVGRKMAEAFRRVHFPFASDNAALAGGKPGFADAAAFADSLEGRFDAGEFEKVVLVRNHFVSAARQHPVVETLFPLSFEVLQAPGDADLPDDIIVEPSAEDVVRGILPLAGRLKMYAALLDSSAAEHAARAVAMQSASDNAEKLLSELVLEYNKGRQQRITAEILDLVGGAAE